MLRYKITYDNIYNFLIIIIYSIKSIQYVADY